MVTALIQFVIALVVAGIVLWGGNQLLTLVPGYEAIKKVIRVVVICVVAIWLLGMLAALFGVGMPWGPTLHPHR